MEAVNASSTALHGQAGHLGLGQALRIRTEVAPWSGTLMEAFAASPSPMVITDARAPDNPIVWANAAFLALTGYRLDEIVGRNCRMLQGVDTDPAEVQRVRVAIAAGEPVAAELINHRKDGTAYWTAMTITPVRDGAGVAFFYASFADMTHLHRLERAMRGANDELERQVAARTSDLRAALEQKTVLLHELDHRVKNNLQVISSLMLLKTRRTPEGEARDALQGMAERIGALSTAHRMLYSEGEGARFDLGEFANEFLGDVAAGLDTDRTRIDAAVDSIAISAAMAAPLALMIHELIANALRHAFPGDRSGTITIQARRTETGLRVVIGDDGVGIGQAAANPAGFGRDLVAMVVRQMRGTISWAEAGPGTRVEIDIPIETPVRAS